MINNCYKCNTITITTQGAVNGNKTFIKFVLCFVIKNECCCLMNVLYGGCERSGWWAAVLQVSVHWLLCEDSAAERLYPRVETGAPTEQLGRAVLAAYHARKAQLSGASCSVVLQLCNSASLLLQQSLTVDACHKTDLKVQASSFF